MVQLELAIERDDFTGTIHCASPGPVTNGHFMKTLRRILGVPFGLPNPAPLLRFGAVLIGTEADLILTGRRVISKTLADKKFNYRYPTIESALENLLK